MTRHDIAKGLHAMLLGLMILLLAAAPALAQESAQAKGRLYLVGLGAGDPDNMTIRAQKIIAAADVVFSMKGVQERYADLLAGKELHEAGHGLFMKMGRRHVSEESFAAQEQNARQIIRQAVAQGKTVAILDNGDPMIFGPHAGYLQEFKDLNPEVIPGLSSFNAANAALQKSVTSGKKSHAAILTAAMGDGEGLAKLAKSQSTMVFFTMRLDLPKVVEQLKKSYPGNTPMAIVFHAGSRQEQKVLLATLDTIVEKAGDKRLPFEHLIYIGDFLN